MDVIQWLIEGIPVGCVYALVAIGLVLTYKTTGVFNLAFSAQAFLSAWVMYDFVEIYHRPLWLGFVVSALIVAPAVGFILDRALFRFLRTAPNVVKLVTALGLFVAVPEIVKALFEEQPQFAPPSVAPLLGISKDKIFHIGDYVVAADRMATVIVTVAVVVGLGLLFRYTALGLQMRALVESPRMVELAGVDAERTGTRSWMLSSFLAGVAGVMLAPLFSALDANNYILLIVAAIAAAAVGRLTSIPMTLVGGLILGVGQRALPDILDHLGVGVDNSLAQNLRPAFPFLLLFGLLVFWPALRNRRDVTDPLAGVDPPAPAMAHEYKTAELARFSRVLFVVLLGGFLIVMMTLVTPLWVSRLTTGFTLAVVFLSITVFTGFGGQISLAQATFAGVGGFTMANLANDWGIPVLVAMVMGAILAAVVGALLAIPRPAAGRHLSVARDARVRAHGRPGRVQPGRRVEWPVGDRRQPTRLRDRRPRVVPARVRHLRDRRPRGHPDPQGLDRAVLRRVAGERDRRGVDRHQRDAPARRALRARRRGSRASVAGSSRWTRRQIYPVTSFPPLLGIAWVVLVVSLGSRTVDGAVNAAIGFVVITWLLSDALQLPATYALILFGLSAFTYARHPEGIVELQTRRAILAQIRGHSLNVRSKATTRGESASEGVHPGLEGRAPRRGGARPLHRLRVRAQPGPRALGRGARAHAAGLHPAERRVRARRGCSTPTPCCDTRAATRSVAACCWRVPWPAGCSAGSSTRRNGSREVSSTTSWRRSRPGSPRSGSSSCRRTTSASRGPGTGGSRGSRGVTAAPR